MKITRISSLVVNANMRNWIFVKVETDQDGLYGWGEAVESNAVSVYVHQLRRKLGADFIGTMRGVGYFVGRPGGSAS